jgi:hypothetical protein
MKVLKRRMKCEGDLVRLPIPVKIESEDVGGDQITVVSNLFIIRITMIDDHR